MRCVPRRAGRRSSARVLAPDRQPASRLEEGTPRVRRREHYGARAPRRRPHTPSTRPRERMLRLRPPPPAGALGSAPRPDCSRRSNTPSALPTDVRRNAWPDLDPAAGRMPSQRRALSASPRTSVEGSRHRHGSTLIDRPASRPSPRTRTAKYQVERIVGDSVSDAEEPRQNVHAPAEFRHLAASFSLIGFTGASA